MTYLDESTIRSLKEKSLGVLDRAMVTVCLRCHHRFGSDVRVCPSCSLPTSVCFPASSLEDRYPFVYPRDQVFICEALDEVERHEVVKKAYYFLKMVQENDGEWVQRYDTLGHPRVSRTKETDCVGLVLHGIYSHYCATEDLDFLKEMWQSIEKGVSYIVSMTESGLVRGEHSVFECGVAN